MNFKKYLLPIVCVIVISVAAFFKLQPTEKERYTDFLNNHPYSTREHLSTSQLKEIDKRDRPDLAWEQNFLETMDPALGYPTPEKLLPVYNQVQQFLQTEVSTPGAASTPWMERGPNNVGGRTRAIMVDPNASSGNKVWAGGVTGGLWYNNDITDANSQWVAVDDFWDNLAISAIAYDPTNTSTFYVSTGESWGQSTSGTRGAGIWKSTDGGLTWSHISSTSGFYYVNDLVVRNENGTGVVYAACRGFYYSGQWHGSVNNGVQRSVNGGTSWTQVMPNIPGQSIVFAAADLEIAADNRLWVGSMVSSYGGSDRGGGRVLYSDNGTTWTISNTITNGERVEVACAPNNSNYVYAITEVSNQVGDISRTTNKGNSWTSVNEPNDVDNGIPASDFSRGQAWYDLILAVDPNNANTVITGGIDLFRTTDGGTNWSQISKWSNNNNLAALNCSEVHADQHQIIFKGGSSSEVIFGNDGGVYYTNSVATGATSDVIYARNNGYNVTQFYACAQHPNAGSSNALAGAQDNGTQRFTTAGVGSSTEATGGDGAYCFIDQTNPLIQISSYVYNSYWRSTNGGISFGFSRIQDDQSTGKFINPTDYDDNQDALYSARTTSTINRISNVGGFYSVGSFSVSGMSSMASHLRVSPYTTSSTTLFVGCENGDVFKITNADGTLPSASNISSGLPTGNISCVEIGANENEVLVTLSNYGVTSVWYTSNGGTTWVSKEGNLPDMPVRWALFNPNDRNEVILATEVGIWSTTNLNSTTPTWSPSNSGLANVRVDMLQIRDSDNMVLAATHGRGLFESAGFALAVAPTANFGADKTTACLNETISFTDSSTGSPTTWSWSITPNTFSYVNGTSSSSQHPQVQFTVAGNYTISLTASNSTGSDIHTVTNYITAGGQSLPFTEDFESNGLSNWQIENPDNSDTWQIATVAGNAPGTNAASVNNYSYNANGQRDGLISPPLDFTGYSNITLTFDYAYRRYSSSYQDSLAVYISTNCGTSWTKIASYREDGSGNFVTGSDVSSSFVPSSSTDWCGSGSNASCPSISLNGFTGYNGVLIKFENINGYGNNLYIDNINISGTISNPPVADFAASTTTFCQGDTVSFTDVSTNTPTTWSWNFSPSTITYVDGTSVNSQNPKVKINGSGNYTVNLTVSNASGTDNEQKVAYLNSTALIAPSVSIAASADSICAGTQVTFTATPVNGGGSPTYQWKVNGVNAGANSATFSSNQLADGDVVSVEMTSSESCLTTSTATSNAITIKVINPVTPSVTVAASATSICVGSPVTFTASPVNGGTIPAYQWKVNGINVGANAASYTSSTLANGDVVRVELTSSESCVTSSTAMSSGITMSVSNNLQPSVSVTASATTICSGDTITFTASPVNGGSAPVYQWKVNGNNVGLNMATFSSSSLSNGDVVTVELTSSEVCASPTMATSSGITITVNAPVTPAVSIVSSVNNICAGTSVTFTATPTNGGSSPSCQWKVNGSSVGPNAASFSTSTLANGDVISVELTSSESCVTSTTASSTGITMNVTAPVTPTVSIAATDTNICTGANVVFTVSVINGGTTPAYQWKVNGANVGTNASTYSSSTLSNSDVVSVELTSSESCVTAATVTSSGITMSVANPLTPSVSIVATDTSICAGSNVMFTATAVHGGPNPQYQWKINGTNTGTNAASFSSTALVHGDVVTVELTSSESCVSTATATSAGITMSVTNALSPSVHISASDTIVCVGEGVSFTATVMHGGFNPSYQWKVNGSNVGTNAPSFSTSTLVNGDAVSVELTSSESCVTSTTANSNTISVTVNAIPVVQNTTPIVLNKYCDGDTVPLRGIPVGGTFSGPGVTDTFFVAAVAGTGVHEVWYHYTDPASMCGDSAKVDIWVEILPKPTITRTGTTLSCDQNGYSYTWFMAGVTGPVGSGQTLNISQNGDYYVQIATADCYKYSDSLSVNDIGIETFELAYAFEVFPNPSADVVHIKFRHPGDENLSLELYAANGKLILKKPVAKVAMVEEQLSLGRLASGLYFIKVSGEKLWFSEQIEKS